MTERRHYAAIDLPPHGEFKARLFDVKHANRTFSKRALAKAIVEGYSGSKGLESTISHWLVYEKWELAIVYCGMIAPLN